MPTEDQASTPTRLHQIIQSAIEKGMKSASSPLDLPNDLTDLNVADLRSAFRSLQTPQAIEPADFENLVVLVKLATLLELSRELIPEMGGDRSTQLGGEAREAPGTSDKAAGAPSSINAPTLPLEMTEAGAPAPSPAIIDAPSSNPDGSKSLEQLPLIADDEAASETPLASPTPAKKSPRPPKPALTEITGFAKWVDGEQRLLLIDCGVLVRIDLLAGGFDVKEGDLVRIRNPMPQGKMTIPVFLTSEMLEVVVPKG